MENTPKINIEGTDVLIVLAALRGWADEHPNSHIGEELIALEEELRGKTHDDSLCNSQCLICNGTTSPGKLSVMTNIFHPDNYWM